jgi:hypothetical protein
VRVSAARAGYTSVAATLTGVAEEAAVIVPTPVTETPVNPTPVVNPPLAAAAPSPAQFLAAPGAVPSTVRVAPVVGTGAGAVTVNGVPVPFEISQSGNTRTFASSDGSSVSITPGSGAGSGELIAGAMLQILFGGEMKVGVAGFLPGSTVDVWAFSTPTFLGTFAVDDASGTFALPADLEPGDHTLVLTGTALDGAAVSYSIEFAVYSDDEKSADQNAAEMSVTEDDVVAISGSDTSAAAPAGWTSYSGIWIGGLVLAALIASVLILRRRLGTKSPLNSAGETSRTGSHESSETDSSR